MKPEDKEELTLTMIESAEDAHFQYAYQKENDADEGLLQDPWFWITCLSGLSLVILIFILITLWL